MDMQDYGPRPYVVNVEALTKENELFRVAKWTGAHLQMTVMSIPVGGEVGLERHEGIDQFLRIEQGRAKVQMGPERETLDQEWEVGDDDAVFVPAGTWHNLTNSGDVPLKLYSIYAAPEHAHGTVHRSYGEAQAAEA